MRLLTILVLSACIIGTLHVDSYAASTGKERTACVKGARKHLKRLIKAANLNFKDERDACVGPCREACFDTARSCISSAEANRDSCINTAQEAFKPRWNECKTLTGCTSKCAANLQMQECLAPAKATKAAAVIVCNETGDAAVAACRSTLNSCRAACTAIGE